MRLTLMLVLSALSLSIHAQNLQSTSSLSPKPSEQGQAEARAAILDTRPWSLGVFAAGGFASAYRFSEVSNIGGYVSKNTAVLDLELFNAGLTVGKVLSKPAGPSFLKGQFELEGEFLPYWQAHYPAQVLVYHNSPGGGTSSTVLPFHGQNRFGMSVTPFLCRWDFRSSRWIIPWVQLGGGLLWTNHKFPQYPIDTLNTSVINFTPQFGIGANLFLRPHQSLFFAVNAIHISNASLGDSNPGVNITTQFRVGYSWWK
jgi:lipid A 3-O-deacylase